MLRGVTFNDKHTYDDWGLFLSAPPIISQPEPNLSLVAIPGGNGYLNFTKALSGAVTYSSRAASFSFISIAPRKKWAELYSEISNYLHGEEVKITLDEEPDYYYTGVVQVEPFDSDKTVCKITITGSLDPFKYEKNQTVASVDMSSAQVQTISISDSGTNVSGQSWNTDWRFGTANLPQLDLSNMSALTFTGNTDATKTHYKLIQVVDGSGNFYETTPVLADEELSVTISTDDIAAAGVDLTSVYRILISGVGQVTVSGTTTPCALLHVEGSKRPAIPVIDSPADGLTVSCEKVSAELEAGLNQIEDIVIQETGADLLFRGATNAGTVTVTYQKGWL